MASVVVMQLTIYCVLPYTPFCNAQCLCISTKCNLEHRISFKVHISQVRRDANQGIRQVHLNHTPHPQSTQRRRLLHHRIVIVHIAHMDSIAARANTHQKEEKLSRHLNLPRSLRPHHVDQQPKNRQYQSSPLPDRLPLDLLSNVNTSSVKWNMVKQTAQKTASPIGPMGSPSPSPASRILPLSSRTSPSSWCLAKGVPCSRRCFLSSTRSRRVLPLGPERSGWASLILGVEVGDSTGLCEDLAAARRSRRLRGCSCSSAMFFWSLNDGVDGKEVEEDLSQPEERL
jgi:hypothetical protein